MYVPEHHQEANVPTLHALMKAHPLGARVTQSNSELVVSHFPFLIDPRRGELGTLLAHVARANPVWQSFSSTVASVVIF